MDTGLNHYKQIGGYPNKDIVLKLIFIGDCDVGKTTIIKRYAGGHFGQNYEPTIGADFSIKSMKWDKETNINLLLWDIAGHERFGHMTSPFYKYAAGCAIVFDVSRLTTFVSIKKWLAELREKVVDEEGTEIPVVILANKWDLQTFAVSQDTLERFCSDNKINAWFQTSAKEGRNIDEAITFLIKKAIERNATFEHETRPGIQLTNIQITAEKRTKTLFRNTCC